MHLSFQVLKLNCEEGQKSLKLLTRMNIPCMKPSKFHQALSHIDNEFRDPKILLEQYPTDIPTTHELIYLIQSQYGDIEGKMIADLGCGVGVLGIGAALLGASYVLGVDIDQDALELCQENIETLDLENIDLLQLDVTNLTSEHSSSTVESESSNSGKDCSSISGKFHKCFDTVIMNPPFGTKNNEGIDMKFVQIALDMANNSVYSFHKTSTRTFIQRKAKKWNIGMETLGEVRFLIPQMYKCHKTKSVDIQVDFIRFFHK